MNAMCSDGSGIKMGIRKQLLVFHVGSFDPAPIGPADPYIPDCFTTAVYDYDRQELIVLSQQAEPVLATWLNERYILQSVGSPQSKGQLYLLDTERQTTTQLSCETAGYVIPGGWFSLQGETLYYADQKGTVLIAYDLATGSSHVCYETEPDAQMERFGFCEMGERLVVQERKIDDFDSAGMLYAMTEGKKQLLCESVEDFFPIEGQSFVLARVWDTEGVLKGKEIVLL